MKNFISFVPVLILVSCTYSVSMTHSDRSQGSTDTTEETSTSQPNISPNLNIPVTPKA